MTHLAKAIINCPLVKEVVLVNDSELPIGELYLSAAKHCPNVRVINHPKNRGRAAALNSGGFSASGSILWILDADCWPDQASIQAINAVEWSQVSAIRGQVFNRSNDFWSRYQNENRANKQGFNTANFFVKKSIFCALEGFDKGFSSYGFEDRDFLLRLQHQYSSVYNPAISVEHFGEVSIASLRRKMYAGARSGFYFKNKHPQDYQASPYAKVDFSELSVTSRYLLNTLNVFSGPFFGCARFVVGNPLFPYWLKKLLIPVVSGLAYFQGTKQLAKH